MATAAAAPYELPRTPLTHVPVACVPTVYGVETLLGPIGHVLNWGVVGLVLYARDSALARQSALLRSEAHCQGEHRRCAHDGKLLVPAHVSLEKAIEPLRRACSSTRFKTSKVVVYLAPATPEGQEAEDELCLSRLEAL